jgi:hypothetical protein
MKYIFILCLVLVSIVNFCQADEPMLASELEEIASLPACPCSKSCRCDESCRCRTTGCRGCCDSYKTKNEDGTVGDECMQEFCNCVPLKCGCGCSGKPDAC